MTGKYRAYAHKDCDLNLKLSEKIPAILHILRGSDNHLIMQEIGNCDVKIHIIPNGLEKCMVFAINKNFVFIDRMQYMNSSLEVLVKNLSNNDFRYLSQECSGKLLRLVNQKGVYLYEYFDSFKKCINNRLPDRFGFHSSSKYCFSDKDYLHAANVWNMFQMKTMIIMIFT